MSSHSSDYYFSPQQQGIDRRLKNLVTKRCLPYLKGDYVLDIGFVDGLWADPILNYGWDLDIVEIDSAHVKEAETLYGERRNVRIIQSSVQGFVPDRRYNSIIAGDVLRYIEDPVQFLRRLGTWLAPGGCAVVTVPNSRSLHRRIGTLMGMESHPEASNSRDVSVGNLRGYDRYKLRNELQRGGLKIIELRGCILKPLSSYQMMDWSDELLQALLEMGDELEDYAWFLYAICSKAEDVGPP